MDRDELLDAGNRALAEVLLLAARTAPGASAETDGRLVLVSASRTWPGPYHNGALRLDRSLPPAEVLARAQEFFASRSTGYCVWIADGLDDDLEAAAIEAGLVQVSAAGTPRMAIEHPVPAPIAPPGVALTEVVDERGRRDFVTVTVAAYADDLTPPDDTEALVSCLPAVHGPRVRTVVARDGERPVAAAMVVAADMAASVETVGTIPGERGRGLARACTSWAVNTGFDLGGRAVVLEASAAGAPLYLSMGFVEVSRSRLCYGPSAPTPGRT